MADRFRKWPRFSLRSLILFVALTSSGYGMWYNLTPWRTVHVLKGHSGTVMSATFSPDGRRIVTASEDMTARVWERRRPEYWWGMARLLEFWVTLALGVGLLWSLCRDRGMRGA